MWLDFGLGSEHPFVQLVFLRYDERLGFIWGDNILKGVGLTKNILYWRFNIEVIGDVSLTAAPNGFEKMFSDYFFFRKFLSGSVGNEECPC